MFVEELKNKREWDEFLQASPDGTFYHSLEWKEVVERSFPHSALYLTIKDANEKIVGICPGFIQSSMHMKFYHSIPYSDYGGPVIGREYTEQASILLRSFIQSFCSNKGIAYAKICFLKDGSESFFKSPRCYVNDGKGVVNLDIGKNPPAFIWNSIFRKKHRKKINRFKKDGFQVREASTRSDLKLFFSLYSQNMKHIGAQAYPAMFFDNMWNLLYPENFNILFVEGRETLGGLAFFRHRQTIYLTYLGLDRKLASSLSRAYNVAPFLYWSAIEWAEKHNCRYICFGSTPASPKSESERVNLSQKVMFGGSFAQQEIVFVPFNYYALTLLLLRSKITTAGKAMRHVFPQRLQRTVELRLGRLF